METMTSQEIGQRLASQKLRNQLKWNEEKIMQSAKEMAARLKEIKDEKLWSEDYGSFEDYCQQRWGFGAGRARQLLNAENTRLFLADAAQGDEVLIQNVSEMNEGQLRAISQVEPPKRLEVLRKVIETGSKPSPNTIKRAAGIETKAKQVCPHCHQTF